MKERPVESIEQATEAETKAGRRLRTEESLLNSMAKGPAGRWMRAAMLLLTVEGCAGFRQYRQNVETTIAPGLNLGVGTTGSLNLIFRERGPAQRVQVERAEHLQNFAFTSDRLIQNIQGQEILNTEALPTRWWSELEPDRPVQGSDGYVYLLMSFRREPQELPLPGESVPQLRQRVTQLGRDIAMMEQQRRSVDQDQTLTPERRDELRQSAVQVIRRYTRQRESLARHLRLIQADPGSAGVRQYAENETLHVPVQVARRLEVASLRQELGSPPEATELEAARTQAGSEILPQPRPSSGTSSQGGLRQEGVSQYLQRLAGRSEDAETPLVFYLLRTQVPVQLSDLPS